MRIYSPNRGVLSITNGNFTGTSSYFFRAEKNDGNEKYRNTPGNENEIINYIWPSGYSFVIATSDSLILRLEFETQVSNNSDFSDLLTLEYGEATLPSNATEGQPIAELEIVGAGNGMDGICTEVSQAHDRSFITPYGPAVPQSGAWWQCRQAESEPAWQTKKSIHDWASPTVVPFCPILDGPLSGETRIFGDLCSPQKNNNNNWKGCFVGFKHENDSTDNAEVFDVRAELFHVKFWGKESPDNPPKLRRLEVPKETGKILPFFLYSCSERAVKNLILSNWVSIQRACFKRDSVAALRNLLSLSRSLCFVCLGQFFLENKYSKKCWG